MKKVIKYLKKLEAQQKDSVEFLYRGLPDSEYNVCSIYSVMWMNLLFGWVGEMVRVHTLDRIDSLLAGVFGNRLTYR